MRLRREVERRIQPLIRNRLRAQADEILAEIRDAETGEEILRILNRLEAERILDASTRAMYVEVYAISIAAFGTPHYNAFRRRFASGAGKLPGDPVAIPRARLPDWDQIADRWVQANGGRLIVQVSNTTIARVQDVVRRGLEEGAGTDEIARGIRRHVRETYAHRANTIARTETLRASSVAGFETALQAQVEFGIELEKVWIHDGTREPREDHIALDGITVPMNEDFDVAGEPALYPRDPRLSAGQSIQCACTVGFQPAAGPQEGEPIVRSTGGRDERIRARFDALKCDGTAYAMQKLHEEEGLAIKTIDAIVYRTGSYANR